MDSDEGMRNLFSKFCRFVSTDKQQQPQQIPQQPQQCHPSIFHHSQQHRSPLSQTHSQAPIFAQPSRNIFPSISSPSEIIEQQRHSLISSPYISHSSQSTTSATSPCPRIGQRNIPAFNDPELSEFQDFNTGNLLNDVLLTSSPSCANTFAPQIENVHSEQQKPMDENFDVTWKEKITLDTSGPDMTVTLSFDDYKELRRRADFAVGWQKAKNDFNSADLDDETSCQTSIVTSVSRQNDYDPQRKRKEAHNAQQREFYNRHKHDPSFRKRNQEKAKRSREKRAGQKHNQSYEEEEEQEHTSATKTTTQQHQTSTESTNIGTDEEVPKKKPKNVKTRHGKGNSNLTDGRNSETGNEDTTAIVETPKRRGRPKKTHQSQSKSRPNSHKCKVCSHFFMTESDLAVHQITHSEVYLSGDVKGVIDMIKG